MMRRCLLLAALLAVAVADSSYYESEYPASAAPAPNNYYANRRQGGLAGLVKGFFNGNDNRRQFTGPGGVGGGLAGGVGAAAAPFGLSALGPIIAIALLFGAAAVLGALALSALDFNSSGRGLDTDEWEVDHSVWMNQLQKDFEDSWSTE